MTRSVGIVIGALLVPASPLLAQGYSPAEAAKKMTTLPGLAVTLFAAEPDVRQPIFVQCDDRGRLWTIQYLQYPNPAGLKRVQVDRWSRTVYDRIPEPPPRGPRGADRVTICEDTDGDGRADRFTDFVDGLNLCTGLAFGHGGVFVLQVPYLLFYPDRDRDDVPDADPEVLLEGFGMEDAQALVNHLTWGPDGWLYGVNGSTTTCRVRGIEFQQGCWRYHPSTREFELFCEGGQNTFGLTFDENGELFYSTNGGPFVHGVQGGLYYKSFGKHGPLHQPHAYHYFPPLVVDQVPGGPPTGGTIYQGTMLPATLRGAFVAGNFLGHSVSWWERMPSGSTFTAKFGGVLLDSHDTWFGATDLCVGPDGSIYVSDFHDARTAHPDPDANWDRSNGRIYRLHAVGAEAPPRIDLAKQSSGELVEQLLNPNRWMADRARVELAHRRDPSEYPRLRLVAGQAEDSQAALQGLWALYVSGGVDDETTIALLDHPYPHVRRWLVRWVGDEKAASDDVADRIRELAEAEEDPAVRAQLAATARRLPAPLALEIVERLLDNPVEPTDDRLGWLIWWALEAHAIREAGTIFASIARGENWDKPAFAEQLSLLARRYAAEGTRSGYDGAARLLASVTGEREAEAWQALALGLAERGRPLDEITQGDLFRAQAAAAPAPRSETSRDFEVVEGDLKSAAERHLEEKPSDPVAVEVALRSGILRAGDRLKELLDSGRDVTAGEVALATLLPSAERIPILVALLDHADGAVRQLAVRSLAQISDEAVGKTLLARCRQESTSAELKSEIRRALLGRPDWALLLLQEVDSGSQSAKEISVEDLRVVAAHSDDTLDALVRKHWGNVGPGTTEEKLATMRRLMNDLRAAPGDLAAGQVLYVKHCGTCHKLGSVGQSVGPDLTTANRHDRAALLGNIVDPSSVIRREYLRYVAETETGQVLAGLLAEQDAASVTLLDERGQRTKIDRAAVVSLSESQTSLMPERILESLSPQEIRNLFAFLEQK